MSGRCDDKLDATHTTAISAVQAAYNIRLLNYKSLQDPQEMDLRSSLESSL